MSRVTTKIKPSIQVLSIASYLHISSQPGLLILVYIDFTTGYLISSAKQIGSKNLTGTWGLLVLDKTASDGLKDKP